MGASRRRSSHGFQCSTRPFEICPSDLEAPAAAEDPLAPIGAFELLRLPVEDEGTRALADELGSAPAGDRRVRLTLDDGSSRARWDLRFADEDAAARSVALARSAYETEGWSPERVARDVRLAR